MTTADALGWEDLGFRRGWSGPLQVDPGEEASLQDHVIKPDRVAVRSIDRTGGTILHTSRTNPGKAAAPDMPPAFGGQPVELCRCRGIGRRAPGRG